MGTTASGVHDSLKTREQSFAHASSLGYSGEELQSVPAEVVVSHGCGNAVSRARLQPGETVVDLGSGAGLDAFLAARQVGPAGRVIGVDIGAELVRRSNAAAAKAKLENLEFKQAPIERLPLSDESADVAISNCVLNHCSSKRNAFKEIFRVLKIGGRLCLSDLVTSGNFSEAALKDDVWGEWLQAAFGKSEYLRAIEEAGFDQITVEGEGAFAMAETDQRLKGRVVSIWVTARKRQKQARQ